MRKLYYGVLSFIPLIPLLPFLLMNLLGELLVKLSDWCCENRAWTYYLIDKAEELNSRRWK